MTNQSSEAPPLTLQPELSNRCYLALKLLMELQGEGFDPDLSSDPDAMIQAFCEAEEAIDAIDSISSNRCYLALKGVLKFEQCIDWAYCDYPQDLEERLEEANKVIKEIEGANQNHD